MMGMKLDMNVVGGPSKDPRCLRCHATGHDAPAAYRRAGFRMLQGVACEKCHGPRGAHVDAMGPGGGAGGQAAGPPGPASAGDCQTCHHAKRSHEPLGRPPFDYEAAWARVAH